MPPTLSRDTAKLVLTIVVIELVSGFTQGYYEPLIPKFGLELGVDASGLQLFNVIPTALAAILVPFLTRMGDIRGYRFILRIVIPAVLVATVLIWAGAAADGTITSTGYGAVWIACSVFIVIGLTVVAVFLTGEGKRSSRSSGAAPTPFSPQTSSMSPSRYSPACTMPARLRPRQAR